MTTLLLLLTAFTTALSFGLLTVTLSSSRMSRSTHLWMLFMIFITLPLALGMWALLIEELLWKTFIFPDILDLAVYYTALLSLAVFLIGWFADRTLGRLAVFTLLCVATGLAYRLVYDLVHQFA